MIDHNTLHGLNKNEFYLGADKWRRIETSFPYIFEKQDNTNGDWTEAVPPKTGAAGGSVNGLAPYRPQDYPPTSDISFMFRSPNDTSARGNMWETTTASDSWDNYNYSAVGGHAVIVSKQDTINFIVSNDFMISRDGKNFTQYAFDDLEGGATGFILSIVWDGLRFVMLHADKATSGAKLKIYWSDHGISWAPPPNSSGAIFTTDSAGKWFKLASGNIPGEVMFVYYSTASLDGFANAYHTAHSENGFDVADLNDASIVRSNAAAAFYLSGFIFKFKETWMMTASSLSLSTHQISTDKGANWANKQIAATGSVGIKVFGVNEELGAFVAGSTYFAYTVDGVNWKHQATGGYAYSTYATEIMKSGAICHQGAFYHGLYYAGQTQLIATDVTGKRLNNVGLAGTGFTSKLISIFRGTLAAAGYAISTTNVHKV